MRIRLKGLNSITKTLADGKKRTYWYAWKGGPPLRGTPGTPEFIASYNAAIATKVASPQGVILSILQAYQASEDFRGLADSTRRSYVALITRIEKEFGDFPLPAGELVPPSQEDAASTPVCQRAASGRRQADYAWSVLARVLSWALDRGLVGASRARRGTQALDHDAHQPRGHAVDLGRLPRLLAQGVRGSGRHRGHFP